MIGGREEETSAHDQQRKTISSLRILQWNADGLATKTGELELRLKDEEYDVCLIQETKLRPHHPTPRFPGYSTIRLDRKSPTGGGGLLSLIRNTIIFERVAEAAQNGTEVSTFRLRVGRRKWAVVANVYCPPSRSHSRLASLAVDLLPSSSDAIVLGDFNAHHSLWDPYQPEDERGEELVDWALQNDLAFLNDGSFTRINTKAPVRPENPSSGTPMAPQDDPTPESGGRSAPDVSICGSNWHGRHAWNVVEGIGSSDHLPISVTFQVAVRHGPVFRGRKTWRSSGVDWNSFRSDVERSIANLPPSPKDIATLNREFVQALTNAGHRCVGTVKPGRRAKTWETPAVREAIRARNRLRGHISTRRNEWIEACKNVKDLVSQAKCEAWRQVLDDASAHHNDAKMWRVVGSLNGTPDANSPNEAMSHNGRLITSNKRKADLFVGHYANVSRLKTTKADRVQNRRLKSDVRSARSEEVPPITMTELRRAIDQLRFRGAPGPDGIPPSFLKNLGPRAMDMLLSIFNLALGTGVTPQPWRDATIIPLLKAGKPASELSSFRPISLTSCVAKLLERVISERLYYIAEFAGWFSNLQAGFRKTRGVEDQVLRINQRIADGFHQKERSV
ncbi:MAG: endonuclease/exonuclease/phosphatase family protein, partial [Cyanobacteria bacterium J06607_13]